MNRKVISIIKYILLLAITMTLLIFAFRGIKVGDVIHEMMQANILWVLFSALFSVIAMISRAYRWKLLIESTGYNAPLKKTFYSLMVGYFANLAFPRLGEVTRCGSLSKAASIPFTNLLGTVIVERVIDVLSLAACIFLAAVIEYRKLGDFLNDNIIHPFMEKISGLFSSSAFIIIAILLLGLFMYLIIYYFKTNKQKEKKSKLFYLLRDLSSGLQSIARLKRPWLFIFHSVFIWILYFLGVYVCFFSLNSTSHLGFGASLLLLVAGGIGMSAPVQGGIGAYHLLVSQGLMLYGLSQQDGLTFATLLHSLQLLLVVIMGIASLLILFSGSKKKESELTIQRY